MAQMETITPVHNRFTFLENVVVDIKLEEVAPGQSAMNFYLNGIPFNSKAHPFPAEEAAKSAEAFEPSVRQWAAEVLANPTGEEPTT